MGDKFKDFIKCDEFIFNNNTTVILKEDKLYLFEHTKPIETINFINVNTYYITIKNLICIINVDFILLIFNNKIIKLIKEGEINKYITNNNLLILIGNNKINMAICLNKKTLFNKHLVGKYLHDIYNNVLMLHKIGCIYQYYDTDTNNIIGEGNFIKIHNGNIIEYNGKLNIIKIENKVCNVIEGLNKHEVFIDDIDDLSSEWSVSMRVCIICKSNISQIYALIPCGHTKMCKNCMDNHDNCIVCNTKKEGTNIINI